MSKQIEKPRLQRFDFRVICADSNACSEVRELMSDFEIRDGNKGDPFDHAGIKSFGSPGEALERLRKLQRDAGPRMTNAFMVSMKE